MTQADGSPASSRIFTGPLLAITIINLVFFSGFLFFFPTLPFFLEGLGGRESEIGLLIGVSSVAALTLRPVVGYLVDRIGRKPLLVTGILLFTLNCLLHNLAVTPAAVFPLRIISGAALATVITAATTYLADIAPAERRGEVLSYFALSNALGFAVGPALGGWIIQTDTLRGFDSFFTERFDWLSGARTEDMNFTTLFLVATAISLFAVALALRLPESKPETDMPVQRPGPRDFFAKVAVLPAAINFTTAFAFAGMVTFMPLFAHDIGLENAGSLFVVYAAFVILMRFTVGPFMDRVSRAAVILPGIGMLVATMVTVSVAENVGMLFVAAALWGIGAGVMQPAMMAYMVDRTPPAIRGRAMSTFTMGMDLGIGVGALTLGIVVEAAGLREAYAMAAIIVACGLVLFAWSWFRHPIPVIQQPDLAPSKEGGAGSR